MKCLNLNIKSNKMQLMLKSYTEQTPSPLIYVLYYHFDGQMLLQQVQQRQAVRPTDSWGQRL